MHLAPPTIAYINYQIMNHLRTVLLSWLLLLAMATTAQYEKSIEKADAKYEVGDYADARKEILKMRKKATKKLGASNRFNAIALIKEAKINIGLGELINVMEPLHAGVAMSLETNGLSSAEHGYILLEATEVLIEYGHFRQAEDFIERAIQSFSSANALIEDIQAIIDVRKAQILSGKGFYGEAIAIVNKQSEYYLNRALSSTGSKKQQEKQKEEFAEMMIVKANSLRKMGNYQSADSAFITNLQWVQDNLKKSHLLWAKNAFLNAKLLEENGLSVEAQAKLYEDAYVWAVRKYSLSHNTVMTMQANLMSAYYRNGQKARLKITQADFKRSLKEFGKNSVFNLAEDKMDFTFDLADQDLKRLENKINSMISSPIIPKFHAERIALIEMAQNVALYTGHHENTEAYYDEILKIKAELLGTDCPEYHLTKVKLANYYVDFTDKFDEVDKIYEESFHRIVASQITEGHVAYLGILNHFAKYYQASDKYEKAASILEEALLAARIKYDNQDIEFGRELEKIAALQIEIGDYDNATDNIESAISILDEDKTELGSTYMADALITKAKLQSIKGEYDEAEELIYDSDDFRAEGALTLDGGGLSKNDDLGGLYMNIGRYADASKYLKRSLYKKKKLFGDDSRHLNTTLVLYSKLNLLGGDYTEAEQQARKANQIAIHTFGESSSKTVPSMLQLADVYTNIGDYGKAEVLLKAAIEIQKAKFGGDHVDVGKSTSKLALVYFYQEKPLTQIQSLFQESERIIGKKLGSNNPTYADILKNLAIVNIASGNYSLAITYLNQAEEVWSKKIGKRNNINAATTDVLKGDIYYKQKDYSKAENFYEKAAKQYERVFSERHPEYVKVQSKLSKTYFMLRRYKDSQNELEEVLSKYQRFIKEYFPALSEREKAKFWNTIKDDYEFYNTLIVSRNRSTKYIGELYNNALLTKALLLNSSIKVRKQIMSSEDDELIRLYSDWIENKELLTAALSMSSEDQLNNGINTQDLSNKVEQLEKQISLKSEAFAVSAEQNVVRWEQVKSALAENEAALEMVRFRLFDHVFTDSIMYALFYVKGDKKSEPEMILLSNGKDLESRYLKTYRNSIKYKIKDRFSHDEFWKPINDEIGTVSTLYLSPDGVYNQINLEAIPTPDGKYVIDNSNIVLISNTKDLYASSKRPPIAEKQYAMMFGNPVFYSSTQPGQPLPNSGLSRAAAEVVSPLPGTKAEIEELEELLGQKGWDTDKYTEEAADEATIKTVSNPRIFHVATHGFFKETPKASALDPEFNENAAYENPLLKTGLLLSGAGDILNQTKYNYNVDNGILTAYEAMNLNLDQTDLVVLSACETGLGEVQAGEGVYGLQRAFLVAGARTIVMSLFKVSDEATQQLMVKFYRKWIETGNKRQAFVDAKKEIRNEYRDPIYWGPFVMIGMD